MDWNNVVSAVATDAGLLVTERGADGTVGAPPKLMPYGSTPERQDPKGLVLKGYALQPSTLLDVTPSGAFMVVLNNVQVLWSGSPGENLFLKADLVPLGQRDGGVYIVGVEKRRHEKFRVKMLPGMVLTALVGSKVLQKPSSVKATPFKHYSWITTPDGKSIVGLDYMSSPGELT